MAKLLPILMIVLGLAGGSAAGFFLRPAPQSEETQHAGGADCPPQDAHYAAAETDVADEADTDSTLEYIAFENQFVVPVMSSDAIVSLVVLSLTLEVSGGSSELVFGKMPKLRDAFLSVLFDHSSAGGFSASFVNGSGLEALREVLHETALATVGASVKEVLIADLLKQDL